MHKKRLDHIVDKEHKPGSLDIEEKYEQNHHLMAIALISVVAIAGLFTIILLAQSNQSGAAYKYVIEDMVKTAESGDINEYVCYREGSDNMVILCSHKQDSAVPCDSSLAELHKNGWRCYER